MGKTRIGDKIYNVVPMLRWPYYAVDNCCGEVRRNFEGVEYVVWYA
jgi:hypothetical protein